jgi:hypothetical protein
MNICPGDIFVDDRGLLIEVVDIKRLYHQKTGFTDWKVCWKQVGKLTDQFSYWCDGSEEISFFIERIRIPTEEELFIGLI